MKQVLQHVRSGKLELAEVPEPAPRAGGVVVRNAASLISAGTEKMIIDFAGKSLLGKARERPDLVRQVVDKVRKDGLGPTMQTVMSRLDQPMALGYSCAGVVESAGRGAPEFQAGDRVVFSFVPSCGHCQPCASGRAALCEPGARANAAGHQCPGQFFGQAVEVGGRVVGVGHDDRGPRQLPLGREVAVGVVDDGLSRTSACPCRGR